MKNSTNFTATIEKMDNGWLLYVNADYVDETVEPNRRPSVNVREIYDSLEKILKRIVELS